MTSTIRLGISLLFLFSLPGCPGADDDDTAAVDDDDAVNDDDTVDDDDTIDDDDSAPAADVVVSVDRTSTLGPVRPLLGLNRSPLVPTLTAGEYDFTTLYQWAGVTAVRAHDMGYDLCPVYTDDTLTRPSTGDTLDAEVCQLTASGPNDTALWAVNSPATVMDSANYDFSAVDERMQAIEDGGFELMLRLGESWDGPTDAAQPVMWASVAQRIYEHAATSWPDALDVRGAPPYVEIHNKPDGQFWRGAVEDYLTL